MTHKSSKKIYTGSTIPPNDRVLMLSASAIRASLVSNSAGFRIRIRIQVVKNNPQK